MIETIRNRFVTVSKRLEILETEADKKSNDACILASLRNKLCAQILKDEKLLTGTWVIRSTEHILELEAVGGWESFPGVRELLKPDYHERYAFWGYATYLCFNDGTVSLLLQHEDALQFIRDHGIIVDLSDLTKERDNLVTKLATANAMLSDMEELTT